MITCPDLENFRSYSLAVYWKETHADHYIHFTSCHPFTLKRNNLCCLLIHAYRVLRRHPRNLAVELRHLERVFTLPRNALVLSSKNGSKGSNVNLKGIHLFWIYQLDQNLTSVQRHLSSTKMTMVSMVTLWIMLRSLMTYMDRTWWSLMGPFPSGHAGSLPSLDHTFLVLVNAYDRWPPGLECTVGSRTEESFKTPLAISRTTYISRRIKIRFIVSPVAAGPTMLERAHETWRYESMNCWI